MVEVGNRHSSLDVYPEPLFLFNAGFSGLVEVERDQAWNINTNVRSTFQSRQTQ